MGIDLPTLWSLKDIIFFENHVFGKKTYCSHEVDVVGAVVVVVVVMAVVVVVRA